METITPDHKNCSAAIDRRTLLARGEMVAKYLAFLVVLLPFAKFLSFIPPRKPRFSRVNKVLKRGGFIIEPDFILFDLEDKPIALSRTCTHLGCKLNFHELEGVLICPCHRSRFDKKGKRLAGPARRDLPAFKVDRIGAPDVTGYVVTIV